MRLLGKVGIVTASGSGIGRAGAIRFASEGARVVVVDRDAAAAGEVVKTINAAGGNAWACIGDLREPAFSYSIVDDTVAHFGQLDFLWNHVGVPGPSKFEDMDLEHYALTMDLNLRSGVLTTSRAIPHLRASQGSVVFTASTSGIVASPTSPLYSLTKAGVIGLTRALARRYAGDRIRFNAIAPGAVDTPMLRTFYSLPDADQQLSASDIASKIEARSKSYPLGRIAVPDDIVNGALYLLSDEASFVTGTTLAIDGGVMA